MKALSFTLKEVRPRIFHLRFKRRYDLCMFFLRYQEFYESPNPRFRDSSFELLDFMEWYSHKFGGGCFAYPMQWSGFNIPAEVVKKVWEGGIYDRNEYDYRMKEVYLKCMDQYPDGKFYLIGSCDAGPTMRHEIAHGFFYTRPDYKKDMTNLVKELKPAFFKSMCGTLKEIGYASKVYIDECQAYLSTGLTKRFKVKLKGEEKPFVKLYKEYYNEPR